MHHARPAQYRPWLPLLCLVAAALAPAPRAEAPRIDLQLEQRFENLLRKASAALPPNQRLAASRYYQADGDAYTLYAIRDTAGPGALKTERLRMRMQRKGSRWEIGDEVVEDSAKRLFREGPEAAQYFTFEGLDLKREGLTVGASRGSALAYHRQGEATRILIAADALAYAYAPPGEIGTQSQLYEAMSRKWHQDYFVFTPEILEIACDPVSCQDLLTAFSGLEEAGPDSLNTALATHYKARTRELQTALKKDPFSGFRLPEEEGRRWYRISLRGKDHALWLAFDNRAGHEVRFGSDGFGTIYGYPAEASRANGNPTAIERRDDHDAEAYELTGLTGSVELGLLEPELLQADLSFSIRAKRPLDALPFRMSAALMPGRPEKTATLHVNGLTDGDGRALSWVRTGLSEGIVLLVEPLDAGQEVTLNMQFQTKGSLVKFNPSYSYLSRRGWLPFVRSNDMIDSFDLTVAVPSRYKTLGVGSPAAEPTTRGKASITRWVAESGVRFPTVIFGDYSEDRPETRATRSDGTEIPVRVHVDKAAMADWDIRPGHLRAPGEMAVNALNVFRELYGTDYPYGKLDLVNDLNRGLTALSPASIVYLGSMTFRSKGELNYYRIANTPSIIEHHISHEVAHQWWGGQVSSANDRNYWFVESLAEYSSALFMEILESEGESEGDQQPGKGRNAYLAHVARWRDAILNSGLLASVQDATTLWSNHGYKAAVHARGPYAFHMLRETYGDPKFFAFLKTLGQQLAGKEIVTRDIQAVAEEAFSGTGPDGTPGTVDLDWFFDQWIRDVGLPEYTFAYSSRKVDDGGYVVEGKILQKVFAGSSDLELNGVFYRGVVPVTVAGDDGKQYRVRVVVTGPETPFSFTVPAEPAEVTLNKYGEILARPVNGG